MNATPRTTLPAGTPAAGAARIGTAPAIRAFTLIELLLAMTIFAVVLSAISGVFYGAMRLRTRTAAAIEEALPAQRALAILRQDLAGIVLPRGTIHSNLTAVAGSGDGAVQDTDMAIYTSNAALSDRVPWGEVQRIAYGLRSPTNLSGTFGKDLVRLVTRNHLPPLQDEPEEQRLLAGVQRIEFSFHDGTTWQNAWNATNQEILLPVAVKVLLTLAEDPARRNAGGSPAASREPLQLVVPILVSGTNAASASDSTGGGQP
ncbi:MAG: prepilin-type N-terminal cleavage/methylation domain-containing protein [Verrucomicrobia bacterium]|nr:MAG: prepilin-type N-terminal cleavage/methylation domain-containing protein [Verrucomicrobiota bacterium]